MSIIPFLPLRDIVVFPEMVAPLFVGRKKSIQALEEVIKTNKQILLVTQRNAGQEDPAFEDLYSVGVVANILQLLKLPDGTVKVLVEGKQRVVVKEFIDQGVHFAAKVDFPTESLSDESIVPAIIRAVNKEFANYTKLNKKIPAEVVSAVSQTKDPAKFADSVAAHLVLEIAQKQKLLEEFDIVKRLEKILAVMQGEIEVLNTEKRIRSRVKTQMEKTQKEYYLNEQLKAIHKELGEADGKDEIVRIEENIDKAKMSKEAKEKAKAEVKKLKAMPPMSGEATVIRNYLDWLLDMPWKKRGRIKHDMVAAQKVLDDGHYGLEKVKERILEYLAVSQRTKKLRGPILCLVGPPGVGKTSLARSMAEAIGRNFVKISLGGVRDEAEIRGHRRTYIGAMPGKIIQSLKKAKTNNPLFLLDEIDKLGSDYRGDPASALLEVLDPEQNSNFNDHYLEVDYDLSDIMFVTTANSLNIPYALRDRLEIIRIAGYTEEEKIEITKRHLIKKQRERNGLKKGEWSISEEGVRDLIRYYTREAGVRNLDREIANLMRKAVREILTKKNDHVSVSLKNLGKYAGVRRFQYGETEKKNLVGIVNGLAYTEVGGDILTIEAVKLPGKGDIKSTGKLGDVMQESAQAAFSYARSRCLEYGFTPPEYQKKDLHIHVPEGATPKDGPSAGVAMFTAIISVMTGIPICRTVAMTGEITLRGRVLAIGGLKEKLLAALRGGVETVLVPKENEKDMVDIPKNVKKDLTIIFISNADEAIGHALERRPEPVEWKEEEGSNVFSSDQKPTAEEVITH